MSEPVQEPDDKAVAPGRGAYIATAVSVAVALAVAVACGEGDDFKPRVPTIDALAGLTLAAFLVDRLLTFVPPFFARAKGEERVADLGLLRFGFGALIAAVFVALTNLQALQALTGDDSPSIDDGLDRAIAVLALAGGAKGLARITGALNPDDKETVAPQKPKDDPAPAVAPAVAAGPAAAAPPVAAAAPAAAAGGEGPKKDGADTMAPPSTRAYVTGLAALLVAALVAYATTYDDKSGLELLGKDLQDGGTVAVIVRFGALLVAAGIIQQLIEVFMPSAKFPMPNRPLYTGAVAVLLGVVATRLFDLYLLHNLGFFGVTDPMKVSRDIAASSAGERALDAFATAIIIAAGTKPLHDLSSRLRPAAKKPATA